MVTVKDLEKTYSSRTILTIPHLELPQGKTIALMGPNGAGKTTLLRILGFVDTQYRGEIFLGSQKVAKNREATLALRRRSAFIWQRPVMFNMSVYANIALGLRMRGIEGKAAGQAVAEILERMGLAQYAKVNAKKLSGGEIQRVSIARALVLEPELIFVDEPSSNLDIDAIDLMHSLLLEEKSKGKTIIIVTHNFAEAESLADFAVFLNQGGIMAAGNIPDVLAEPVLRDSSYWRYL